MDCVYPQPRFVASVFPHGKGKALTPKLGCLKSDRFPSRSSLDSLKYCGSILKLQVEFRIPSLNTAPHHPLVVRCNHPQNADLPKYLSKKEKKPFPTPILELRRAARERFKNSRGKPKRPVPPPKNGLLVKSLIPLAYNVLNARTSLINNLKKLLKAVPVHACKGCNEIHVGPVGHPFKSCRGPGAPARKGVHDWTNAFVEDILVPLEAYHLYDRLGKRIPHEERFSIPRVPAVVELCIQAGVDLPEYPTKRRRKPIIRIAKSEFIDADESDLPDLDPEAPKIPLLTELPNEEIVPPSNDEEIAFLAEETLQAWETMKRGAKKLMGVYPVRVCGYCSEVHVGACGHKAQNCGAYKHQQRNGQHGWQKAVIDDLIPPRYVWHVPDLNEPALQRELRNFYGQAPAVVEICVQGGAAVPEQYKSTMRLDIGIPATLVHSVNGGLSGFGNDFLSFGFIPEGVGIKAVSDALQSSFGDGTRQSRDFQAQWLEAWWPGLDDEFAFVVEDDLEVSPLYTSFSNREHSVSPTGMLVLTTGRQQGWIQIYWI